MAGQDEEHLRVHRAIIGALRQIEHHYGEIKPIYFSQISNRIRKHLFAKDSMLKIEYIGEKKQRQWSKLEKLIRKLVCFKRVKPHDNNEIGR